MGHFITVPIIEAKKTRIKININIRVTKLTVEEKIFAGIFRLFRLRGEKKEEPLGKSKVKTENRLID
jgi:hypothetical protein